LFLAFLVFFHFTGAVRLQADTKSSSSGNVFTLNAPAAMVMNAVKEIASDSLVRGTYVYEKEKMLQGAVPADTSSAFATWEGPGTVFYKVLTHALSPRHFKNSSDDGTITVRYVVVPQGAARTLVNINAVFVEDGRRKAHASDGRVEMAEFSAIQEQVEQYRTQQQQFAEIQKEHQDELAKRHQAGEHPDIVAKVLVPPERQEEATPTASREDSVQNLKSRLSALQHALEVQVKTGGADLKSAPFHSAANLKSIPGGTQVIVLVLTPYWYGVETTAGQRGWVRRDMVEPLP
jgi:hypothetical protein